MRLNPLAFPRNPYHHLVKHYQDGQLHRGQRNDPECDARLTLGLFRDQQRALGTLNATNPDLLLAWHWLTTLDNPVSGLNAFFMTLRGQGRPAATQAREAIGRLLRGRACVTRCAEIVAAAPGWPLAYALAWLWVAGGNSVMPPWVRHQFPDAGALVKQLRDTRCNDAACNWCNERHNARNELARWFNFAEFRPEPRGEDGLPLQ